MKYILVKLSEQWGKENTVMQLLHIVILPVELIICILSTILYLLCLGNDSHCGTLCSWWSSFLTDGLAELLHP